MRWQVNMFHTFFKSCGFFTTSAKPKPITQIRNKADGTSVLSALFWLKRDKRCLNEVKTKKRRPFNRIIRYVLGLMIIKCYFSISVFSRQFHI